MKSVNVDGTAISSKTCGRILDVLANRDDSLELVRVQAARQEKTKDLLAFSVSDDVTPTSLRLI